MLLKWAITASILLSISAISMAQSQLKATITSSHYGMVFTEGETPDIAVMLEGDEGLVSLDYTLSETAGKTKLNGYVERHLTHNMPIKVPIVLPLQQRGHYTLSVTAHSGSQQADCRTMLAIVMKPDAPQADSPWGMFWIPAGAPSISKDQLPIATATNMRRLGVSWVRFNFWESVYKASVERGKVWLDVRDMKRQAAAFRKAGISIYGEFAQMPKALSSSSDTSVVGDAGSLYSRVKPKDYAQWDSLVEQIARSFKDEIKVWEVWNEVDMPGIYWSGTAAEYVELVKHTSAAIKRGNPDAKIAAGGFTSNALVTPAFKERAQRMFALGLNDNIDILSIHYSDSPQTHQSWNKFCRQYNIYKPIWNSEEISIVPLENLKRGMRSFKFLHIDVGYPQFRPILDKNWQITPAGVAYATAAKLIGSKPFVKQTSLGSFDVFTFGVKDPVSVIRQNATVPAKAKLLDKSHISEYIRITAQNNPKHDIQMIDTLGRSVPVVQGEGTIMFNMADTNPVIYDGLPMSEPCAFVVGAEQITAIQSVTPIDQPKLIVAEAEAGTYTAPWQVCDADGWSNGAYLSIFEDKEPPSEGYQVSLPFTVDEAGKYDLYFSGNGLSRLESPRTLSPFTWHIDDGVTHTADHGLPQISAAGAPEGLSKLGSVTLPTGKHTFNLRLTGRRDVPDSHYALWFDAIGLVKTGN